MNRKTQTRTIVCAHIALIFLSACGQIVPRTTVTGTPTATDTPPFDVRVSPTPTPTPGGGALMPSGGIDPPPFTHGEVEMHTPDRIGGGDDCVSVIPFTIDWNTNPPTIKGQGRVDCHFKASGECALHMIMAYDITLQGKFAIGDLGEKRLLIDSTADGSLKEYFVNCPSDAAKPPSEDNPWVITKADPVSLNFEYLDGAKVILLVGDGYVTYFLRLKK